jgi:hypothetical protein
MSMPMGYEAFKENMRPLVFRQHCPAGLQAVPMMSAFL